MNTRRVTLIVAIVLAVGAGILTIRFLTQFASTQQAGARRRAAARRGWSRRATSRPAASSRTTCSSRVSKPAADAGPIETSIADAKLIQGDIALTAIKKDTIITSELVGRVPTNVPLTVALKPGMRALTIPIDRVKAVAGLLSPGDRVDVIAVPAKAGPQPPIASAIIRGALVLAINASTDTAGATPSPDNAGAGTVTLGVTPKEADLLTLADLNTTLRLALRSPQERQRSLPPEDLIFQDGAPSAAPVVYQPPAQTPDLADELLRAQLAQQAARNNRPVAAAAAPAGPAQSSVEVIDGSNVISGPR